MTSCGVARPAGIAATFAGLVLALLGVSAADPGTARADLADVWRVQVEAQVTGGPFLCRLVPALRETYLDTVREAGELPDLLRAVIPDSLIASFDAWCGMSSDDDGGDDNGNDSDDGSVQVECRLPLALVSPCSLYVQFGLIARPIGTDSIAVGGTGTAVLHGGPLCPRTECPGTITVRLTRLPMTRSRAAPDR